MGRFPVVVFAMCFAAQAASGAVAFEAGETSFASLHKRGDEVWSWSDSFVYRIARDRVDMFYPLGEDGSSAAVHGLAVFGNEVWFATEDGLYRVAGEEPVEVIAGPVHEICADRESVIVTQGDTLFRVVGKSLKPIGTRDWALVSSGGRCFHDGSSAAVIGSNRIEPLARSGTIYDVRGRTLLFSDPLPGDENRRQLYRVEANNTLTPIALVPLPEKIVDTGQEVWFTANDTVILADVDGSSVEVTKLRPLWRGPKRTWFVTPESTLSFRFHGSAEIVPFKTDENVTAVVENDGIIYYASYTTVRAVRDGEEETVLEMTPDVEMDEGVMTIEDLRVFNGRVYASGSTGVFVIDGVEARQMVGETISRVIEFDGRLWFNGASLFRLDDNVDIVFDIVSDDSWWKQIIDGLLPGKLVTAGIIRVAPRYARRSDGRDPYAPDMTRVFESAISVDGPIDEFKSAERNIIDVDSGVRTLYVTVRDGNGNTFTATRSITVFPGPATAAVALWFLAVVGVTVLLLLAPWVSWCQSLVLNPFVQKYASFGSLRLLLSIVPAARRHLLRRYRAELRAHLEPDARHFVLPSPDLAPEVIGRTLRENRRLLITGRSGIGKSAYLQYLAWNAALGSFAQRAIPIVVHVARYRGCDAEDAIADQLASFGHMSGRNSELLLWFLDEGPFLILFDGLNEVDEPTRVKLRRFIDRHWKRNYFALTSQETYEFDDLFSISLAPLGDQEIQQFLVSRLGPQTDEAFVNEVVAQRHVYGIPQHLEFLVSLVKQGHPVPARTDELYAAILAPIVKQDADGGIDYTLPLAERAFEMIRTREINLESPESQLPGGLIADLRKLKLVIQRDDKTYFTHNLVRDFLAARYLRDTWRQLVPQQSIDADWRATLDFLAQTLEGNDLHALLRIVLAKNQTIARDMFNAVPSPKREPWAATFEREYGHAALER